jgi:hypothetical protein
MGFGEQEDWGQEMMQKLESAKMSE